MKLFISWSGEVSRDVASVLREYLPAMIQRLDVFMSKHDIESGSRWSHQLANELAESNYGIICLTPDNLSNPWILFEAGALTKHIDGRVCCLLFGGLKPTDISGPLSQFQNRIFQEGDMKALLQDISEQLEPPVKPVTLELIFNKWWEELLDKCNKAVKNSTLKEESQHRSDRDILEEILQKVRSLKDHESYSNRKKASIDQNMMSLVDTMYNELSGNQIKYLRTLVNQDGKAQLIPINSLSDEQLRGYLALTELGLVNKSRDYFEISHDLLGKVISKKLYS